MGSLSNRFLSLFFSSQVSVFPEESIPQPWTPHGSEAAPHYPYAGPVRRLLGELGPLPQAGGTRDSGQAEHDEALTCMRAADLPEGKMAGATGAFE